ncbi:MAG: T9SS type A sorting domain-containing protein [Bacteroidales bacterium]|nr:T9SS type A sorting domain-containing protein [Bacteroidales bacterium]
MKKLITLLLLAITTITNAQEIDYFADNPQWRENWTFAPSYPCITFWDYVYYLNGDTVVGDQFYKILYRRGQKNDDYFAPPIPGYCDDSYTFDEYYGLLRQEGKKMFYLFNDDEELLYDFDLAVGDTLPQTYNVWSDNILVTDIDSLLVKDQYRKVFYLSQGFFKPYLIEGIGLAEGFLEYFPQWEFPADLQCFALNDTVYYPEFGAPCDLAVDIDEQFGINSKIELFPNPASDNISIHFDNDSAGDLLIWITDLTGRKIWAETWKTDAGPSVRSLDLSGFNSGMYFIILTGENGEIIARKKILVE